MHLPKAGMLENNAVKRHAFCMRKRVKHAQKFSDITICILVPWYMYFTYPNFFLQLVQWGSDNRGCTVHVYN